MINKITDGFMLFTRITYFFKLVQESYRCRVCGLTQESKPWGDDGDTPSFDICNCCGVQFGYEDCNQEYVKKYRKTWHERKNKWFIPKEMPIDWCLEEQMKNIPSAYR